MIKLSVNIYVFFGRKRHPETRRHVKPVIQCTETQPVRRYVESDGDVPFLVEFRKECSLKSVPVAVKHRPAPYFRQCLKRFYVIRIVFHKECVVIDKAFYENVVFRVLASAVYPVYKKPLYPVISHSARVAGQIHSRPESAFHHAGGAVAFRKALKLKIGEMRRFLQSDYIIGLPLILQNIVFRVAISQPDSRTVRKKEFTSGFPVFRKALKQLSHG